SSAYFSYSWCWRYYGQCCRFGGEECKVVSRLHCLCRGDASEQKEEGDHLGRFQPEGKQGRPDTRCQGYQEGHESRASRQEFHRLAGGLLWHPRDRGVGDTIELPLYRCGYQVLYGHRRAERVHPRRGVCFQGRSNEIGSILRWFLYD